MVADCISGERGEIKYFIDAALRVAKSRRDRYRLPTTESVLELK